MNNTLIEIPEVGVGVLICANADWCQSKLCLFSEQTKKNCKKYFPVHESNVG